MPDEYRVTIRLSPELYTQLEARGSHGQPLAAIVRDALEHYLTRQPEPPQSAESQAMTLAAMAASIADLQGQVQQLTARVDMLAAGWQPVTASVQTQPRRRQPVAATTADTAQSSAPHQRVVYPLAADNVSGPLPFRLRRVNQPVISTPNVFSRTCSPLSGCIRAHFSHSKQSP
jgi:predicted transcriptional regulator